MKKIRFGILGLGPRMQYLAECYALHPQIELVAFCDVKKERSAEVAAKYNKAHSGNALVYSDYEDMVKHSALDALLIGIDPDRQVDFAVDAMNRGIHVMTEVPAAYTIEQCWNLVNTVKKTGAKYMLAEQTRYWNFVDNCRRMAKNGEFGKIIYAEGEYLHFEPDFIKMNDPEVVSPWRCKTFKNPILYMPHELSPLLSVTGGRIEKVSCFGVRRGCFDELGPDICAIQTAIMYNSNDVIFSLKAGFTTPHGFKKDDLHAHWYQIKGSKASVETSRSTLDNDCMKMFTKDGGWSKVHWGTLSPNAPKEFRNLYHGGADLYPAYNFVDAIINNKTPIVDVYTAVETAAPAIKAAESATKGGLLLDVPDFRI